MNHRIARKPEKPVFVDRSGRRRRLLTIVGASAGGLLLTVLGVLAIGLLGAGPGQLPGLPGQRPALGEGAADPTPSPGGTPSPTPAPVVTTRPAASPTQAGTKTATPPPAATASPTGRSQPSHPPHPTASKKKP